MNPNDWRWSNTKFSEDKTKILCEYPAMVSLDEVHAKLEKQFPEDVWDWTVDEGKREVTVFKNHWRVKEKEGLAKGKNQAQIWEEEAIGKCLRMAKIIGGQGGQKHIQFTKDCWVANKVRVGRNEGEARAEVEKKFADYIAENADE